MDTANALPDAAALAAVFEHTVFDMYGNERRFGSLFDEKKVVLVFIRHFFCGDCQDYVSKLATVRYEALQEAQARIVVVGCGEWQAISNYHDVTGFTGRVFTDPTRKIYHGLGMTKESLQRTPKRQTRRSYISGGVFFGACRSIWRGPLKDPGLVGKNGNISQLGGDFIMGPGQVCSFASRMQHTQDHIEVAELMRLACIDYP